MGNRRHSRREFLNLTSAGIAGFACAGWFGRTAYSQEENLQSQDVDMVVFNAKVYTIDSRMTEATRI